jgi:hypothetical protein
VAEPGNRNPPESLPSSPRFERAAAWIALLRDLGEAADTWVRAFIPVGLLVWLPDDALALAKLLGS